MIYNFKQLGFNSFYITGTSVNEFFLGVLKIPCYSGGATKNVNLVAQNCGDQYRFIINGVASIYEDLANSDVYFQSIGTWTMDIYSQDNNTNTDPNNATYFETVNLQVNYG